MGSRACGISFAICSRIGKSKTPRSEGRTDASEEAIEIVTIHSSKGLEWPVVIPINTATQFISPPEFLHRQSDNSLHWVLGGVTPVDLAQARAEEEQNEARERERMWYVACTRARDFLILPHLPAAPQRSWSRILDLDHARLPQLSLKGLPEVAPVEPLRGNQSADRRKFRGRGNSRRRCITGIRMEEAERSRSRTDPKYSKCVQSEPRPRSRNRRRLRVADFAASFFTS